MQQIAPLDFFQHLRWLDGKPLLDRVEPYRQRIFTQALYTLEADGTPRYNRALVGRGKKNWKSADLALAGLYRFLAWKAPAGNPCAVIANDEDQADDDF